MGFVTKLGEALKDRDFKVKLNLCQTVHVFGNGKRKQHNLAGGISAFCDVTECQER